MEESSNEPLHKIIDDDDDHDPILDEVNRTLTLVGGAFAAVMVALTVATVYSAFKKRHN